ncbi:MAG: flavohemoglobin expression-modulating QEGLA motif protein [Robiginitomaculum sp.]|nr:flavohemoglobin expression-modulating QEGLA motif protein [Robiginitomaculum sp.]
MASLSPKIYKQARAAAKLLKQAERKIRILRTVAWAPEIGEGFLASGCQALPQVDYAKFDGAEIRDALSKVENLTKGEHPVLQWLARISDKLTLASAMLEGMGTPAFYTYSKQIYGTPTDTMLDGHTRNIDLAQHLDDALSGLHFDQLVLGGVEESFNAKEFALRLAEKLDKYFDGNAPSIELVPHLSAKALASSRRIRVRSSARFTKMDVRQLLHHEALVHAATAMNGRLQIDFPILGAAHAGTTEIQEGLAVFAEIITGAMDPVRFRRLVDRVIAIQMSVDGADFTEVFRFFKDCDCTNAQAYEDTRRVFRGGVITGGAPFTKDGVYLNGLLRIHNFMRTATKLGRADLLRLLFVGKLDIEDVPAIAILAAEGKLTPPQTLPPWAKDMRFLVSYLAYSSFLNRVKLPGFQSYYQDKLADVPDLWGFA